MTRQLDDTLAAYNFPPRPSKGWIHAIRTALGMSVAQLSRRLGLHRTRGYQLEEQEISGAMTLRTLERVAGALDCGLVYVLVPKTSLSGAIQNRAHMKAQGRLDRVNASMSLEAAAISQDALNAQARDLTDELVLTRPRDLWDD